MWGKVIALVLVPVATEVVRHLVKEMNTKSISEVTLIFLGSSNKRLLYWKI